MTKFSDQLFDDLMREHGPALAATAGSDSRPAAVAKRHPAARRTLLAAGAGGVAVAATVSALVAGGGTPAYAVTTHPDGTVTLAVYQKAGFTGINTKLRQIGDDQVVVVPVAAGCPSLLSLPAPQSPADHPISMTTGISRGGSVTVNAKGIPAGDILVVGIETTSTGKTTSSMGGGRLTSAPAPSCVSLAAGPPPPAHGG